MQTCLNFLPLPIPSFRQDFPNESQQPPKFHSCVYVHDDIIMNPMKKTVSDIIAILKISVILRLSAIAVIVWKLFALHSPINLVNPILKNYILFAFMTLSLALSAYGIKKSEKLSDETLRHYAAQMLMVVFKGDSIDQNSDATRRHPRLQSYINTSKTLCSWQ